MALELVLLPLADRLRKTARGCSGRVVRLGSATSQVRESGPGNPELRRSIPFLLLLESRKRPLLAPYSPAATTGSGAPFGEDRYPVTVFLALTSLTTISNNMGSLPLKN